MNKLKIRREELKKTQKEVSNATQMDLRLYQYYESEQREPKVGTAIKIAKALQTTVEELYGA